MWKLGEFCGQKSPKTGKSCRFCLFLFVIEGQSFSLRVHCMVENFLLFGTAAAGAGAPARETLLHRGTGRGILTAVTQQEDEPCSRPESPARPDASSPPRPPPP